MTVAVMSVAFSVHSGSQVKWVTSASYNAVSATTLSILSRDGESIQKKLSRCRPDTEADQALATPPPNPENANDEFVQLFIGHYASAIRP
jgi:hypothetical protein